MIGKRLKMLRTKTGKDQLTFAKILGVSQSTLSHYETGRRDLSTEIIRKIIDATKCNVNWLYTGEGSMFMNKNENEDKCPVVEQLRKSIARLESEINNLEGENKKLTQDNLRCMKKLLAYHEGVQANEITAD